MEKQVIIGILAIMAISVGTVLLNDASITGMAYGYNSKLYGPGLKNAYQNPVVFGKGFAQSLTIQRSQQYMLANRDKWDCSFTSSEGPFPCMQDEATQKWCCLLPPGVTKESFLESQASPEIPGAKFPQYIADDYKPVQRPATKLGGIAGR
jgi:hypothetical protein